MVDINSRKVLNTFYELEGFIKEGNLAEARVRYDLMRSYAVDQSSDIKTRQLAYTKGMQAYNSMMLMHEILKTNSQTVDTQKTVITPDTPKSSNITKNSHKIAKIAILLLIFFITIGGIYYYVSESGTYLQQKSEGINSELQSPTQIKTNFTINLNDTKNISQPNISNLHRKKLMPNITVIENTTDLNSTDDNDTITYYRGGGGGGSSGGGSSEGGNSSTVSCSDGIMNGDETDIDCGGSCEACMDFYVSATGNDSNNGLSSTTPWRSLNKVSNAFANGTITAGDKIGFHAGDTFIGTLNTTGIDGTAENPIIITSYSSGAKPTFTGLITLNDSWTSIGGNIWRYNVSTLPTRYVRYLLLNRTNQKMAQSIARYANNATTSYLIDTDLGGSDNDYADAEVVMRTTAFTWEVRNVTGYNASSGKISYYPATTFSYTPGSGGSVGGYIFQNSLHILQQNAIQNEWVNEGGYIYYYSTTDPYDLGEIKASSIDTLAYIKNSDYITINNINFTYANEYGILDGNSNHTNISNSNFDRCIFALHDDRITSSYVTIDNNVITNSGSGGLYQNYPVNITVTNNNISDTGLEIGKMPPIAIAGLDSEYWGYNAIFMEPDGGLIEYNNIINAGYMGMELGQAQNHALIQHNYVENPCLTLVDCGAFYVYYDTDTTSSNINKITFKDNIAVFDDYDNLDYTIGYNGSLTGWAVNGFYKDGYFRAANYYDNFAFGFQNAFFSNPSMYSVWQRNVGIDNYYTSGSSRAFYLTDIGAVLWTNNTFENNTFISNYFGNSRVGIAYENQLNSTSGNLFDYNKMLEPLTTNPTRFYILGSATYLSIDGWKAKGAVGPHETSNLFLYNMSGLSNASNFIWYAVNPTKNNVSVNFPPGYRYYTVDGNIVLNDTLGAYKGKVYYRTIDEGMPQASNAAINGNSSIGDVQTGAYTYSHEEGNTESGSTYQWYRSYDGTVEARVNISGATSLTYNMTINNSGQYIIFGIKPKSAAGSGSLRTGVERFSTAKYISTTPPSCSDGIMNGNETDIDCGGGCEVCSNFTRTFYVSNSGNDSNNGTSRASPWKTISKINNQSFVAGDGILFKRGDTWHETLIINSSGNTTAPITFGAYSTGNKPTISGFTTLASWADQGGGIYASSCTSCDTNINMVTLDGTPQALGRYPNINESNSGYLIFESHSGRNSITDNELAGTPNWTGAEVVVRPQRWELDKSTVISHVSGTLTFSNTSWDIADNFGYFFQKDERTLDRYSEWYFNTSANQLKMFFGTENPGSHVIKASVRSNLINVTGKNYIVFDQLSLEGADISAIYIYNSQNITVKNCNITDSGRNGIHATRAPHLRIENNSIDQTLDTGINLQYYAADSSPHSVIRNNTVTNNALLAGMGISGSGHYTGIMLYGSSNCTVEFNRINNTGYDSIYFCGNSTKVNNNILDNFCRVTDDGGGIYTEGVDYSLIGSEIKNNSISNGIGNGNGTDSPNNTETIGVYLDVGSNDVEVSNNTVKYATNGIFTGSNSRNNNIHDNTLIGSRENQIYLSGSNNNSIENNSGIGISGSGLYLYSSSNNRITSNFFTSNSSIGIQISISSNNNTIINNTGISNFSNGIYVSSSTNNTLVNNTGIARNSSTGLSMYTSSNNRLNNNIFMSNFSWGMLVANSYNNTFMNNIGISNTSYGVYVYYSAGGNVLQGQTAIGYSTGSRGIYISYSNGTLFTDCVNISGISYDVQATGTSLNNTFLNCSYNTSKESVSGSTDLTRKWYLEANITNSTGNPINGANVTVYNTTGAIVYSALTNSTGNINRTTIIEYVNTGGTRIYQTPHTINLSKTGYNTNSTTYNITSLNNIVASIILT